MSTCPGCNCPMPPARSSWCALCKQARNLFNTTRNNLKNGFNRKNKGSPELSMTLEQFCAWRSKQTLECHYCGIAQDDLVKVGMKSQIQRPVRVLGVDRVDSAKGYCVENLVPCCFVCNQIKGDRFSSDEMRSIGQAVGLAWRARLGGLESPVAL